MCLQPPKPRPAYLFAFLLILPAKSVLGQIAPILGPWICQIMTLGLSSWGIYNCPWNLRIWLIKWSFHNYFKLENFYGVNLLVIHSGTAILPQETSSKSASSFMLLFSSHSCAQTGFLTGVTREFLGLLPTIPTVHQNLLGV